MTPSQHTMSLTKEIQGPLGIQSGRPLLSNHCHTTKGRDACLSLTDKEKGIRPKLAQEDDESRVLGGNQKSYGISKLGSTVLHYQGYIYRGNSTQTMFGDVLQGIGYESMINSHEDNG